MNCIHLLFLVLCLSVPAFATAGEQPSATPTGISATIVPADERSLLARESKQYLAQLTEERNALRTANETLSTRQGLLIGYGVLMTMLAGWLMKRALTAAPVVKPKEADTDIFPTDGATTTRQRKNATITIRNGATQQAEVTGKIQTRHAYARSDTGSHQRPTVRVEQASDRLAPVEVAVKPGSAPIHRATGRVSGT